MPVILRQLMEWGLTTLQSFEVMFGQINEFVSNQLGIGLGIFDVISIAGLVTILTLAFAKWIIF